MRWTCPKCGKKLDVSNEQLIANDGVIVCPQCLLQAHQPIPKARVASRRNDGTATNRHQQPPQSINFAPETPPEYKPSVPPPHKTRMKQARTSYQYTGLSGSSNGTQRPVNKSKATSKKKNRKKKKQDKLIGGWGCLGRTVVFTLVLFAAYVFFGLLLEALQ